AAAHPRPAIPLAPALARDLPHLFWAGGAGLRGGRARGRGGARARPAGAERAVQPLRRRHARPAQRLPGGRGHPAL
ncbi:MAG: hypothetical protein AVDCRST_MAG59-3115, partial [uncultured Thermomicrobiales bacterium]